MYRQEEREREKKGQQEREREKQTNFVVSEKGGKNKLN